MRRIPFIRQMKRSGANSLLGDEGGIQENQLSLSHLVWLQLLFGHDSAVCMKQFRQSVDMIATTSPAQFRPARSLTRLSWRRARISYQMTDDCALGIALLNRHTADWDVSRFRLRSEPQFWRENRRDWGERYLCGGFAGSLCWWSRGVGMLVLVFRESPCFVREVY